jgi:aspartate carbamoyltransferase catalytic subunit
MERTLPSGGTHALRGRVIANMFFEASTRTNTSFQVAAMRLGANVIQFFPERSSVQKGESFEDTIRMMDGYVNGIVIRHPEAGSAQRAAEVAENPVINAGDGGNQHPTQTLLDLYTIRKLKGKIEGCNIVLFGDLKHARAMRSLLYGAAMFGASITLSSPQSLAMDPKLISEAKKKFGASITVASKPDLSSTDVFYTCRIQRERFKSEAEARKAESAFRITAGLLRGAPKEMSILHPLPKIDEIHPEVCNDPRIKYFDQARNGVPVRMAVLKLCLRGGLL